MPSTKHSVVTKSVWILLSLNHLETDVAFKCSKCQGGVAWLMVDFKAVTEDVTV